jgi:hypothetical protein
MSTYKRLNKQDAFITTYTAHKPWAVTGSAFSAYSITYNPNVTGTALNSLQQLYYPTKVLGNITSHSYDYYNQTTLYQSQSRNLTTGSFQLNIPRALFGTAIKPQDGFMLKADSATLRNIGAVFEFAVADGYVSTLDFRTKGPIRPEDDVIATPTSATILDDGEGLLYLSGSSPRTYVGDIIYPHGTVVVTNRTHAAVLSTAMGGSSRGTVQGVQLTFKSSQPIFTHNYHCKVREFENNFTYNPSALTSSLKTVYDNEGNIYSTSASISDGRLNNNVTGSSFAPYITTVGLYNDANELIAVGKLNRPVPKPANTEMTIIVKIDI